MDRISPEHHELFSRLADLYARMEEEYTQVASAIGLDCSLCEDNCCVSYFQHRTSIEWAYLWHGLHQLTPERREAIAERSRHVVSQCRQALDQGERPRVMCPLNEQGRCILYPHRLMICRLHGVPNKIRMPDGQVRHFPGCHMCQELLSTRQRAPVLDRTRFYVELAELERDFAASCGGRTRVNMTLAEMVTQGPPPLTPESDQP
jgi:hypothetical protein